MAALLLQFYKLQVLIKSIHFTEIALLLFACLFVLVLFYFLANEKVFPTDFFSSTSFRFLRVNKPDRAMHE